MSDKPVHSSPARPLMRRVVPKPEPKTPQKPFQDAPKPRAKPFGKPTDDNAGSR